MLHLPHQRSRPSRRGHRAPAPAHSPARTRPSAPRPRLCRVSTQRLPHHSASATASPRRLYSAVGSLLRACRPPPPCFTRYLRALHQAPRHSDRSCAHSALAPAAQPQPRAPALPRPPQPQPLAPPRSPAGSGLIPECRLHPGLLLARALTSSSPPAGADCARRAASVL
ncbi:hypothetical protein ZWY2020_006278 [Hordeum vulgare]|nr:hypothetical protein ZWY2020_006278 [Hordeum vulgare]